MDMATDDLEALFDQVAAESTAAKEALASQAVVVPESSGTQSPADADSPVRVHQGRHVVTIVLLEPDESPRSCNKPDVGSFLCEERRRLERHDARLGRAGPRPSGVGCVACCWPVSAVCSFSLEILRCLGCWRQSILHETPEMPRDFEFFRIVPREEPETSLG